MYPCIFLAFYMSVRKLQGFITFHFLAFLEVFLKCYISLYFSYTHIEGKENTRICNFWWNVTYPCIFLALYMCVRKIQGYVTFHGKKVEKLHILVFSLHIRWPPQYFSISFPKVPRGTADSVDFVTNFGVGTVLNMTCTKLNKALIWQRVQFQKRSVFVGFLPKP